MGTDKTRSIAARIPMASYLEVQRQAAELKMSISEYVTFKLFADQKPADDDGLTALLDRVSAEPTEMRGKLQLRVAVAEDTASRLFMLLDQAVGALIEETKSNRKVLAAQSINNMLDSVDHLRNHVEDNVTSGYASDILMERMASLDKLCSTLEDQLT